MADLTIKDASFGMNTKGAEQYIEDIKEKVLKEAGDKLVEETENLDKQLSQNWQGNSKDQFYETIKKDAEKLRQKLEDLVNDLEKGFQSTRDSLDKFDKSVTFQSVIK